MRRFFILLVLIVSTFSCDIDQQEKVVLTILADRTDAHIPAPTSDDVRSLIDLKDAPNTGVLISFQNLGNVDFSPVSTVKLPTFSLLDNGLQRTANIQRFYTELDSLMYRENEKDYDFHNSSILYPLIDHLKKLRDSDAHTKQLLLYSDLMEFSDIYNSYSGRNELLKRSTALGVKLRSVLDVPNLKGVVLTLKYYPKTNEQNRLFKAWCRVYKELFRDSELEIRIDLQYQKS